LTFFASAIKLGPAPGGGTNFFLGAAPWSSEKKERNINHICGYFEESEIPSLELPGIPPNTGTMLKHKIIIHSFGSSIMTIIKHKIHAHTCTHMHTYKR